MRLFFLFFLNLLQLHIKIKAWQKQGLSIVSKPTDWKTYVQALWTVRPMKTSVHKSLLAWRVEADSVPLFPLLSCPLIQFAMDRLDSRHFNLSQKEIRKWTLA